MPPLVSVLMPVRDNASTVAMALHSILAQTLQDIEVVIVAGPSSDDTIDLVRQVDDRRVQVIEQRGRGIVDALNAGLAECHGPYVARMDGDDVSHPQRLARQVAFLEANMDVGVVGCAVRFLDGAGHVRGRYRYPVHPQSVAWKLNFGSYLPHPGVLMRRSVLPEPTYTNQIAHAEDYDLWLRLRPITRLANLPQVLLDYRLNPASVGGRFAEQQVAATVQAVTHNLASITGREPETTAVVALVRSARGLGVDRASAMVARGLLMEVVRSAKAPRRIVRSDAVDRMGHLASAVRARSASEALRCVATAVRVAPAHAAVRAGQAAFGRFRGQPR